jgi:hypothetical protein
MPFFLMVLGIIAIVWAAIGSIAFDDLDQTAYLLAEIAAWLCFGIGLVWYKLDGITAAILGKVPAMPTPRPVSTKPHQVPKHERGLASACPYCKSCGEDDGSGRMCLRFSTPIPEPAQENPCQGSFWEARG